VQLRHGHNHGFSVHADLAGAGVLLEIHAVKTWDFLKERYHIVRCVNVVVPHIKTGKLFQLVELCAIIHINEVIVGQVNTLKVWTLVETGDPLDRVVREVKCVQIH